MVGCLSNRNNLLGSRTHPRPKFKSWHFFTVLMYGAVVLTPRNAALVRQAPVTMVLNDGSVSASNLAMFSSIVILFNAVKDPQVRSMAMEDGTSAEAMRAVSLLMARMNFE